MVDKSNTSEGKHLLFEGLTFYMRPCSTRQEIRLLLETHGGLFSKESQDDVIVLTDSLTHKTGYHIDFIHHSIDKDVVQDLSKYKLPSYNLKDRVNGTNVSIPLLQLNKARRHYIPEEDAAIFHYLTKFVAGDGLIGSVGGNLIWKEMERKNVTPHSWQSMKNRYFNHIQKQPPKFYFHPLEFEKTKDRVCLPNVDLINGRSDVELIPPEPQNISQFSDTIDTIQDSDSETEKSQFVPGDERMSMTRTLTAEDSVSKGTLIGNGSERKVISVNGKDVITTTSNTNASNMFDDSEESLGPTLNETLNDIPIDVLVNKLSVDETKLKIVNTDNEVDVETDIGSESDASSVIEWYDAQSQNQNIDAIENLDLNNKDPESLEVLETTSLSDLSNTSEGEKVIWHDASDVFLNDVPLGEKKSSVFDISSSSILPRRDEFDCDCFKNVDYSSAYKVLEDIDSIPGDNNIWTSLSNQFLIDDVALKYGISSELVLDILRKSLPAEK